jgi:predicted phosphodiesterase
MRIGLASDSLGDVDALERALAHLTRAEVERVFFLGARLSDLDEVMARRRGVSRAAPEPRSDAEFLAAVEVALARQAAAAPDWLDGRLVKVASRACAEHVSGVVPTKQVDLVEGRICCLVHDKAELDRDDIANASILFHGHAPAAGVVAIGPRVFVTPGPVHPPPGGGPGSFAIADVGAAELTLTVFGADLAEIGVHRTPLGVATRMSVR